MRWPVACPEATEIVLGRIDIKSIHTGGYQ